jgi:RNA recognition motif-containing protein
VGNLRPPTPAASSSSSSLVTDLKDKFDCCGEILDVDVKKSGHYAAIQFVDVSSVCKAIKSFDGEQFNGDRLRLGFARPAPTKCVWCSGLPAAKSGSGDTFKTIQAEFGRFGKVQDVLYDDVRGHALIYYDQVGCVYG